MSEAAGWVIGIPPTGRSIFKRWLVRRKKKKNKQNWTRLKVLTAQKRKSAKKYKSGMVCIHPTSPKNFWASNKSVKIIFNHNDNDWDRVNPIGGGDVTMLAGLG